LKRNCTHLKGLRAIVVQIAGTSRRTAFASASRRRHCEGQIVTVHQTNVVEVIAVGTVECDFSQGRRRVAAGATALEHAPAIASLARPRPGTIEIAP
jgi:hypothetical protein